MNYKGKPPVDQVYYPETIPDTLTPEIERISRDNQFREYNEIREDRKERKRAKNARILSSKNDKYLHAINLIIKSAEAQHNNKNTIENGNDPSNFIISEYDFNFENSKLLTSFFEKLKDAGCFKSWTTNPFKSADYGEFIFSGVNTATLAQFENSMGTTKSVSNKKDLPSSEFSYRVTYKLREIRINGKLIARPNFDGENDLVFDYLFLNPNKKFTRKQIKEGVKIRLKKSFHKIAENLGFRKDLRKLFFNISSNSIQFNNPVNTHLELNLE